MNKILILVTFLMTLPAALQATQSIDPVINDVFKIFFP